MVREVVVVVRLEIKACIPNEGVNAHATLLYVRGTSVPWVCSSARLLVCSSAPKAKVLISATRSSSLNLGGLVLCITGPQTGFESGAIPKQI